MKDIFGNELQVGQLVATNYHKYTSELVVAEVIGFTAHKVKLRKYKILSGLKKELIFLKFPEQLAVKK